MKEIPGQISLFDIADKPLKFHEAEWLRAHGYKNVYEEPPKAGTYEFTDIEHPTKTKRLEVSENGGIMLGGLDFVARWWRPIQEESAKAAAPVEDFTNPPPVHRYLRYGPHTLIPEVREKTKEYLDQNGVPEWVKWEKDSLPCENCTWNDGTKCCSGGHTNHFEYGYLICDGFYQSCVERKPSTVGEGFPNGIEQKPHIYPLDIKGICDDPYCPQCGYAFETTRTSKKYEVDCERCPVCHIKVDWTLWHRLNDDEPQA